jgi:hypothetical protein
MQMMIRTALTALLTASITTSNIDIAIDAKIENYENYIALGNPGRD